MTAGLELDYDVNLDEVIGAGGQGDVLRAERKVDKLQVAIKVTPRARLRPGPGGMFTPVNVQKILYLSTDFIL
jgi:hypothetical protein